MIKCVVGPIQIAFASFPFIKLCFVCLESENKNDKSSLSHAAGQLLIIRRVVKPPMIYSSSVSATTRMFFLVSNLSLN
jgi:hypothetical protein